MTDYSYIQLAVHGQFDGEVKTVYTYPSSGDLAAWSKELFDPSVIIKNFLNARDCYVIQQSERGHCFGLITRNPLDSRSGYILLSMLVDEGYALTGRQIVNTLGALKKTLLEDGDRFDDAVTRCLEAVGLPSRGMMLATWAGETAPKAPTAQMCYRTYVSGQELETIMSFPSQPEYRRFERVVVIAATASLKAGVGMERVTSPVKKIYSVVLPEGVTASKPVVAEGERLQLTYSKEGFNPRKETVIAGAPSPYVRYEGSALKVKSPTESGMGFVRRVKIMVKSAKGGLVTGYTINVNGRPVNTMEPYVELNELELAPGKTTEISVASNNYRPLKVVAESAELASREVVELVLQPMEQGIMLRLDFGEGRIFEQEISIEKNTPEYSQLHSGNFHGFRAHRLTTAGEGEIYNVDVRAGSKPTAPSFVNVTEKAATTQQRAKAPVFENVASGAKDGGEGEPKAKGKTLGASGKKTGYIVGAALAVAMIVLAFIFILPGGGDSKGETAEATAAADTMFTADSAAMAEQSPAPEAAPATAPAATPAPSEAEAEKADIAYLNDNRNWNREELKSAKYKELVTAFEQGDIQAIASHDYFARSGESTNRYANDVVTWLWQAKGTFQEGKNVNVLKDKAKDGRINLYELWEAVSRYKPSQPNPEARPSK